VVAVAEAEAYIYYSVEEVVLEEEEKNTP